MFKNKIATLLTLVKDSQGLPINQTTYYMGTAQKMPFRS